MQDFKEMSLEGLELIGRGGTGEVYRVNDEQILKLYFHITPETMQEQKNTAREIFKAGVPTAISFETVRIGDRYGIIYELFASRSIGKRLKAHPEEVDEIARKMAELLKTCHSCRPENTSLERMNDRLHTWIDRTEAMGLYSAKDCAMLREIAEAMPDADTVLHCDFHEGNIMSQNGEYLLIDVDDVCLGHPIYDLTFHYMNHELVSFKPELLMISTGLTPDLAKKSASLMRSYYFKDFGRAEEKCIRRLIKKLDFFLAALSAGRLGGEHDFLDASNVRLMKLMIPALRLMKRGILKDLRKLSKLEASRKRVGLAKPDQQ